MATSNKRLVKITYKHTGARPPVYVAGSFTTPAWEPQELEAMPVSEADKTSVASDGSEYAFSKQFEVAVGDWQYKFRLGEGDWWVCDESAAITTDDVGNQNNVLIVKPQSKVKAYEEKHHHARPPTISRDSGHARDSTGSSRNHDEATDDHIDHTTTKGHSHKKHCNLIGHHNPNCSAHGVSSDAICICDPPPTSSDNIPRKEKLPAIKLPYSAIRTKGDGRQGGLEKDTQLPLIPFEATASTIGAKSPATKIGEVIDENDDTPASEADKSDMDGPAKIGDREMSAADAERVKLLTSVSDVATAPAGTVIGDPIANLEPNDPETTDDLPITQSASYDLCPLFSHERLTPDDPGESHRTRRMSSVSQQEEGRHHSLDFPQLEVFPSGTGQILKRIATTRSQLDADETIDETVSAEEAMPVIEPMNSPTFSHERFPAEQSLLHRVRTPSLNSLPSSISTSVSHERKHPDMDVISEQEDMDSFDEDEFVAKYSHEGTIDGDANRVQDLMGVDGSADLRPIREERGADGRRYSTAAQSGYNLPMEDNLPGKFNGTISQCVEDERQPLLNSNWTVQGDYTGFPRTSFESDGARKRRAVIESSATSSETSEVTAIPVPFYVTLWLWCLHCLNFAFAKIFWRGKEF